MAEPLWVLFCLLAGLLFFFSLGRLWPLADVDLTTAPASMTRSARRALTARGFELAGFRGSSGLTVDTPALDYVESAFGRLRTQGWIVVGLPLVQYRATFKHAGGPTTYDVYLHPDGRLLGWSRSVEEDEAGARWSVEQARQAALEAIETGLALVPAEFEERTAASTEQLERRDHTFIFERRLSESPELRERVRIGVAGDVVVSARRWIPVPPPAERAARAAEAPGQALVTAGMVLATICIVGAFFVFLQQLRLGRAALGRALPLPGVVFGCLMVTYGLERASLFRYWEPLWPKWVSDFQYLSMRGLEGLMLALLLFVLIAGGDALDRQLGAGRGASLWTLVRGRIDRTVAAASARGFLVGLLCGGAMAAAVILLELVAGARTSIQPRGFFFYTLNSAAPALASLTFFLGIALAEEMGYRYFGGTWLLSLKAPRSIAIAFPALVYGLTHTLMDFLPPAEPWWARPLVLTLVGAVWGWAFLRFDALTVVLSHFTADLFIFNWPRLASAEPDLILKSAATIAVPLLPALLWLLFFRFRNHKASPLPT